MDIGEWTYQRLDINLAVIGLGLQPRLDLVRGQASLLGGRLDLLDEVVNVGGGSYVSVLFISYAAIR